MTTYAAPAFLVARANGRGPMEADPPIRHDNEIQCAFCGKWFCRDYYYWHGGMRCCERCDRELNTPIWED